MDEIRDGGVLFEDPGCECVVCAEVIFLQKFFFLFGRLKKSILYYISMSSYMNVCCVKAIYRPKKLIQKNERLAEGSMYSFKLLEYGIVNCSFCFQFFLQDTKSSNGTFINNQRLSKGSEESPPRELFSGDIVQFGVDVMENSRKGNSRILFP